MKFFIMLTFSIKWTLRSSWRQKRVGLWRNTKCKGKGEREKTKDIHKFPFSFGSYRMIKRIEIFQN